MMRFSALQDSGLAFLLTLAAMPTAGCDFEDPEPSDDASGSSDPTNATTTATSASSTDAADTTGDPETGDPETSGGADPTGDPETTGGSDPPGDPSTGGDGQICEAYAAHIVLCYPQQGPNQSNFVGYCQGSLDYYASISPACLAAAEDLFACIVALDCEVLLDDGTCPTETAALEACG